MMPILRRLLPILALCSLAGCGVSTYRDTLATSYGYLAWAQVTYKTQCQAAPTSQTCSLITRGIGLHNAGIDALNAYCSGTPAAGQLSWTAGGPCAPVKTLEAALVAALGALKPVIADVKMLATAKTQATKLTTDMLQLPETQASLLQARIEVQP